MILYFYIVAAATLTVMLDRIFPVFSQSHSWWSAPAIMLGIIIAFIIIHIAVAALWIVSVSLKKKAKDSRMFRKLITATLRMIFKLANLRVHSTGLEKIPTDERFVLVSNHIHDLDPAVILHEVPDSDLAFIAKKEVRDLYPFVYKALHKMHGLPIDRENNREAAKTIISATKLIKDNENSVAVFPEGYVSLSGELLPIRNGALKMATKTQCKIVVCTLWGTKEIPKKMFRRRHDVYFDVLDVIDTEGNTHTAELGEQISKLMLESIEKRKKESLS